jgi:thioesterase domain-containing protein
MEKLLDPSQFAKNVPFLERTGIEAVKLAPESIVIKVPIAPNINHIGTVYAGAMWTLAEVMGGAVYQVHLFSEGTFPIVKGLNIKFTKPARTDVFCQYTMDKAEASRIMAECEQNGKANYDISLELTDAEGNVVAVSEGFYQIRKGVTLP